MELLFMFLASAGTIIYTMFFGYPPMWVGLVLIGVPAVFMLKGAIYGKCSK